MLAATSKVKPKYASRISPWVPYYLVLAQNLSNQHAHGRESILSVSYLGRICKPVFNEAVP